MKDGRVIESSLSSSDDFEKEKQEQNFLLFNTVKQDHERFSNTQKYEIIIYNQNDNDFVTVSSLKIKVEFNFLADYFFKINI